MPLVIGPGGNILLGPNGGLAGNTNCCCDECCGWNENTAQILSILVDASYPTGNDIETTQIISQTASTTAGGNPKFTFTVRWTDKGQCGGAFVDVPGNEAVFKSQSVFVPGGSTKCCWWEVTMADPGNGLIGLCSQAWNAHPAWPGQSTFRVPTCLGGTAPSGCDPSSPCGAIPDCGEGLFQIVAFTTNLTGACDNCPEIDEGNP